MTAPDPHQGARKQCEPMHREEGLTGRLWEGLGLPFAPPRGIKGRAPVLWVSIWRCSPMLPGL